MNKYYRKVPPEQLDPFMRYRQSHPLRSATANGISWEYLTSGHPASQPLLLLPGALSTAESAWHTITLLEQLMQFGPRPTPDQRLSLGHVRARLLALLKRADHVLCASSRQRTFWLGWLGAAGRRLAR